MIALRKRLFVASFVLLLVGCGGTSNSLLPTVQSTANIEPSAGTTAPTPGPAVTSLASPAATATGLLPEVVDIDSAGAVRVPATDRVDWAVVYDGSAWIAALAPDVAQLNANDEIGFVADLEGPCRAMDVGFDAIWTATCHPAGIARIDPATGEATSKALDFRLVEEEASVGAGEGGVWLVTGVRGDTLTKLDPETLDVVASYTLEPRMAGVRAGLGGVWVTNPSQDHLLHVDPESGEVVATIAVGDQPRFLAVGEGGVWVMNQSDGSVSHVDPSTDSVVATIDAGKPIDGGDIAVGGGSVWLRGGPEMLARIDPAADTVIARYGPEVGSGSVTADDNNVWITAHDVSTVWRLPLH